MDVERGPESVAAKEEIPADHDRDHVAETSSGALVVNGALGEYRRQQPDDEKDTPASGDYIFRELVHGAIVDCRVGLCPSIFLFLSRPVPTKVSPNHR